MDNYPNNEYVSENHNELHVNKNVYLSQKAKNRRQNRKQNESLEEREMRSMKRRQKYKE